MNFLYFLLFGAVVGWLAGTIMKGSGYGLLGDIVVGIVGAMLGGWLFGMMGIATYGLLGSLVMAVVGAIILIAIVRMIAGRRS